MEEPASGFNQLKVLRQEFLCLKVQVETYTAQKRFFVDISNNCLTGSVKENITAQLDLKRGEVNDLRKERNSGLLDSEMGGRGAGHSFELTDPAKFSWLAARSARARALCLVPQTKFPKTKFMKARNRENTNNQSNFEIDSLS